MDINQAFGKALKEIRLSKGISQEKLSPAVSRVYISSLERGLKSPTLMTVDKLAKGLDIHPITLLIMAYCLHDDLDKHEIVRLVKETKISN